MSAPLHDRIKDVPQDNPSLDMIISAAPDLSCMPKPIAAKYLDNQLKDGLLFYQGRIVDSDEPELMQELLSHFHDTLATGYQGCAWTLELISRHYYWPAIKSQVSCYMDSGEICQRSKSHKKYFALQPLPMPDGPWEDISYDFMVKLLKSKGMDSILVVVDRFSKMLHLIPCKETATAEDVAQMFLQQVWRIHGTPKQTISGRRSTFNSKFLRSLYKFLQIDPKFSTAYYAQTNGYIRTWLHAWYGITY